MLLGLGWMQMRFDAGRGLAGGELLEREWLWLHMRGRIGLTESRYCTPYPVELEEVAPVP